MIFFSSVSAQRPCQQPQSWLPGQGFDTGKHSTVAVLNSTLVVEFTRAILMTSVGITSDKPKRTLTATRS
jgi:hypothetical protein